MYVVSYTSDDDGADYERVCKCSTELIATNKAVRFAFEQVGLYAGDFADYFCNQLEVVSEDRFDEIEKAIEALPHVKCSFRALKGSECFDTESVIEIISTQFGVPYETWLARASAELDDHIWMFGYYFVIENDEEIEEF